MYATKAQLSRIFGVTVQTVHSRVKEIQKEIGKRYNRYAICENLISVAVYADHEKYRKLLADKNLRKAVPPFDMEDAEAYIIFVTKKGGKESEENSSSSYANRCAHAIRRAGC